MSLPPDEYSKAYKEHLEARFSNNSIVLSCGVAFDIARDEEATALVRLRLLRAGVDVLQRGKSTLADHPDLYGDANLEYVPTTEGFRLRSEPIYYGRTIELGFGGP